MCLPVHYPHEKSGPQPMGSGARSFSSQYATGGRASRTPPISLPCPASSSRDFIMPCRHWFAIVLVLAAIGSQSALLHSARLMAATPDITTLDQHFNQPGADISPWMFVPE